MENYFILKEDGKLESVGNYVDFTDADNFLIKNSITALWIFTKDSLLEILEGHKKRIQCMLDNDIGYIPSMDKYYFPLQEDGNIFNIGRYISKERAFLELKEENLFLNVEEKGEFENVYIFCEDQYVELINNIKVIKNTY